MTDLITLYEYKDSQGIVSTKEDTKISLLIPSVSQLVKTYCGNAFVDFYEVPKEEEFTLNWVTHSLQLTETPVVEIVSVEERNGISLPYTALTKENFQWHLSIDTDTLFRTNSSGACSWPIGIGAVRVAYKAGYLEVPADLKLAVLDLTTYYLKDEHKERRSIAGASIQNASSTSQSNNVAFPDHIKRVLDLYKNF